MGRVAALRRFPVKSMAGEELAEAEIGWTGLAGDREYAFVRSADTSDFPWFTGRQLPELVLHQARFVGRRVSVATPLGVAHDAAEPALCAALEAASGQKLHLFRLSRGCHDAMPVSVLTTAMLHAVGATHGAFPGPLRFRANLLIETAEDVDERDWIGAELAVGDARLRADWPIPRCAMIGIDPDTAARDPSLLRTVARQFGGTAGLYAAVARPGRVRVGDTLHVG